MKLEECIKGTKVLYVPPYADGDVDHPDCEYGVIYSHDEKFAFVKYDPKGCTAAATFPSDLIPY